MYRSFVPKGWKRAVVHLSQEARAYKETCGWIAKCSRVKPMTGPVELHLLLVPANRVCMDLDNSLKIALDSLSGIIYNDDAQIYRIVAERGEPDGQARLVVDVSEFIPAAPQIFAEAAA